MEKLRIEAWNNATQALGTSYIFQAKAEKLKFRLRIISILGLAVPILVAALVGSYGANSKVVTCGLIITAPIAVFQAVFSAVSLALKWDDTMSYSIESMSDNRQISDKYRKLLDHGPKTDPDFRHEYEIIYTEDSARTKQDEKYSFSSKEKRKGLHYALYTLQRPCAICKEIPASMEPSECKTCGTF